MSAENTSFSLSGMPIEIILRIFSSLTPETLYSIRDTSKIFNYVFEHLDGIDKDNIETLYPLLLSKIPSDVEEFWYQKFLKHFGHYSLLVKTQYSETCWPLEYIKYAIKDYKGLPKIVRLLISFVKEGDLESLQALFDHDPPKKLSPQFHDLEKLTISHILTMDKAANSALKLLVSKDSSLKKTDPERWQAIADCFFKFILHNPSTDINLLKCAIELNQPKKVFDALIEKKLITKEKLEQSLDSKGNCLVHYAAQLGNLAAMEALVAVGCNVNKLNTDNASPLYEACANGNYSVVEYLLNNGAEDSLGIHNKGFGCTPYLIAVTKGRLDIVRHLHDYYKNDKSCNIQATTYYNENAIYLAASMNKVNVLNYIIDDFSLNEINKPSSYQRTPLIHAAGAGYVDIVIALINKKADIHFIAPNGLTALGWAAQNGHLNIVKLLISKSNDSQITKTIRHELKRIAPLSMLIDQKPELMFDIDIDNNSLSGLNTSVLSISFSTKIVQYDDIKFFSVNQTMSHSKINAFILLAIQHEKTVLNGLVDSTEDSIEKDEFKKINEVFTRLDRKIRAERGKPFGNIVKSLNLNYSNSDETSQKFLKFIDYLISVSKAYTAKPTAQLSPFYAQYCVFNEEKMYFSSAHVGNTGSVQNDNSPNYPQQKM